MDDLDVDLEELESRLYSQIYHGSAEPEQPLQTELNPNSNVNNNSGKHPANRYFQARTSKPKETQTPKEPPHEFIALSTNESEGSEASSQYQVSRYSVPQGLIQMFTPRNNIVVLPPAPTRILNYEKYLEREQARQIKKQRKREKNKRRRTAWKQLRKPINQEKQTKIEGNNKVFVEHNLVVKPIKNDVIVLSDSDMSDCVELPQKRDLVELSSDDETKIKIEREPVKTEENSSLKNDDDIIFIEPEPKQIEVIEIDCDSVKDGNDEKHSETASTISDNLKVPNIPHKRKRTSKESRELRTPDSSASNDFLDSTVDLNKTHFNFGLHGSDFGSTNPSKSKPIDVSETESTTSEAATLKSTCFNVVDFETPSKQFFDDTNLESFGNYITPNRNTSVNSTTSFEQICTKASQRHNISIHDTSGSSSESDYDEDKNYLNSKRLPQLSAVHVETDLVDKDGGLAAGEIPVGSKQMLEKNDGKRKSEDDDTSNKKLRVEEEPADKRTDQPVEEIEIGDHSDFIVIDETGSDEVVENDSDDTESYFSCDEFNNITSDLMLGNCRAQGDGKVQKKKRSYSKKGDDLLNYSVEEVHRTMSDDPKLWKILDIDRLHFRFSTPKGPRCHRCREVGHMALHCTNKQGRPACTLCGERTHAEPRCPMAMCTSCGRLGGYTTYCSYCANWRNIQCNICKLYGHIDTVCPDAWRRYHLTTKPGPIVKPAVQALKAEKDRWCSGCAQSGHFESACLHYNRTHFAVYPEVLHYVELYNFPKSQPYIIHQEEDQVAISDETSTENTKSLDAVESSDKFLDLIETDTEDLTAPEDSFHDAETGTPRKSGLEGQQLNVNDIGYFKLNFPPSHFIPPYFRNQINYLKQQYLKGNKGASATDSLKGGTSVSLEEFISLDSNDPVFRAVPKEKVVKSHSGQTGYQRKSKGCNETLQLDCFQFAYIHTKNGIQFFKDLKRRQGLQLDIQKYDDRPAGEIYLSGHSDASVHNVKKDILNFLRSMPVVRDLPQDSKDMLDFLLRHKQILDKTEGNCWTLCKKLCKLTNTGNRDGFTSEQTKLKAHMQVTIQLLLFGKLRLERGNDHINKIHDWIRTVRNRPNYIIPLNDIFEIYHSYAYLFEPRKSIFPFRNLCAQHDHYILPTVDGCKRRKMPQKNRVYIENKSKFVMETCKKHNLPNKFVTELIAIQNAMEASKYSRIYYGDFLRFMSRFRAYMKKHKIL